MGSRLLLKVMAGSGTSLEDRGLGSGVWGLELEVQCRG